MKPGQKVFVALDKKTGEILYAEGTPILTETKKSAEYLAEVWNRNIETEVKKCKVVLCE